MNELMPQITELYREWCRLKGYSEPTTPLDQMIDTATGAEAQRMHEFVDWFMTEIIGRMPVEGATDAGR